MPARPHLPACRELRHRERGEARYYGASLIGAADAKPRACFDAERGDIGVAEKHVAHGWTEITSEDRKQRALAGTIGANHSVELPGIKLKVDGINGDQAAKGFSDLL